MSIALEPESAFRFPLYWTVGFSGKRFPKDEEKAGSAIEKALEFFSEKAHEQRAKLTAISSLARGGDVLFAQACQKRTATREPLPWKALLPFAWEPFLSRDLAAEGDGSPLPSAVARDRREQANACATKAIALEVVCPRADPDSAEDRDVAYLECGYRTVDEADVLILLLNAEEFAAVSAQAAKMQEAHAARQPLPAIPRQGAKAGSRAVALYALAARRPCILLNAEADDPWGTRQIANHPTLPPDAQPWFMDRNVTPAVRSAEKIEIQLDPAVLQKSYSGALTPARHDVWELMERLGYLAGRSQKGTLTAMQCMLSFHLAASAIAAIAATVLGLTHGEIQGLPAWLFAGFFLLALAKPLLAAFAWLIEYVLHHRHTREEWLNARILSELCRGALSLWPLPEQPLDATDEEDFPKIKRLVRTLRIRRALDGHDPVKSATPLRWGAETSEYETQAEANMRAATQAYLTERLHDQAAHYRKKAAQSRKQMRFWMCVFQLALFFTIILGSLIAHHVWQERHGHSVPPAATAAAHSPETAAPTREHAVSPHAWADGWKYAKAAVIILPFVASFALGMMTLLDGRRRVRRYPEMDHYLTRLADTLAQCTANPSRLRLIEQAERMMIEEQHEWFSVTRNFSV